jgi:formyl-CoA transferase
MSLAVEDRRDGPLSGVRVVECGVWHAGPGAGAILGDLGAEVIKIETLDGDPERYSPFGGPDIEPPDYPRWNSLFEMSNRNKRSICLDLGTPDGYEILAELVRGADVFLTNLRKPSKKKLGIDYESLAQYNQGLVHVNVSGFGAEGPMADVGAFDPLGQAISGMAFLTGAEEPALVQVIILDQLTAITASHAAITALYARDRSAAGQEIDVSLYGAALWVMYANLYTTGLYNEEIKIYGPRTTMPALRSMYRCADGRWLMASLNPEDKYWPSLCVAIGRPELRDDPRFATAGARKAANSELTAILDTCFLEMPRAEWIERLHAHGLLFAPLNKVADVLADPQALANGYVEEFDHPYLGRSPIPGYPARFSATPAGTRRASPRLGEHTTEILTELGLSPERIAELKEKGVSR